MANAARAQEAAPRKKPVDQQGEDAVPVIPDWVREWGWVLLGLIGLVLVLISFSVGARDGSAWGWTLLLAVAAIPATIGGWDYVRRCRARRDQRERDFHAKSEFSKLDAMTWKQLEYYFADLLRALGYQNVTVIGSEQDENGLDILAMDTDGALVGVQVKQRKPNPKTGKTPAVPPAVVRELQGAIKSVQYAGRRGILMTNSYVQPGGLAYAAENGLTIVDRRNGLADWMNQARTASSAAAGNSATGHLHPETRVTLGIIGCALIAVFAVVISTLITTPPPAVAAAPAARATPTASAAQSSPSRPSPEQTVRQFYAAINDHAWSKVWQLGGRNLGRGPYASYSGMVLGYKDTLRDVLTEIQASGSTVTGSFLAYQTNGVTRRYQFTYVVREGVIVSGRQQ